MTLKGIYAQYGCGFCAPKEWRNFDASPFLHFERLPILGRICINKKKRFPMNVEYGDIVHGLPLLPKSCVAVFSSHVLEHLSLEDFYLALRNSYKILKPNGIFRFIVPDLEAIARAYITSQSSQASVEFICDTGLGHKTRTRNLITLIKEWFGNSRHLWMWDYKSLEYALKKTGFKEIRKCQYGDSNDPMFNLVEDPKRYENAVGVECRK